MAVDSLSVPQLVNRSPRAAAEQVGDLLPGRARPATWREGVHGRRESLRRHHRVSTWGIRVVALLSMLDACSVAAI